MWSTRQLFRFIIFCCVLFPGPVVADQLAAPLPAPPLGEQWFGIYAGDERAGFAHTVIRTAPEGYFVASDSSTKLSILGFSREAFSRESYLVNRDLSLRSFNVMNWVDGKRTRLEGEVTAKGVKIAVNPGNGSKEKILKRRGKVYPGPLLNLYPLMQGVVKGKKYRLPMLDTEDIKLKEVTITAVDAENMPEEGKTVHLRNNLYKLVDNDIWVDFLGHTVKESVRDGLVVTHAEKADVAAKAVVEAAIAKIGWIVGFSAIPLDKPIARPADLKRMSVELSGFPDGLPLFSGEQQRVVRTGNGTLVFTVGKRDAQAGEGASETRTGDTPPESAGMTAPGNEQLVVLKNEILKGERDPVTAMGKLARWVAATVAESSGDNLSPLETVKTRKGNCQSHVSLYTALAAAAGLPTRTVAGLVYMGGDFLYHNWAESYAGGWISVDPTLGQVPADATHIKLAGQEATLLAPLIGHVKARLVEEMY